MKIVLSSTHSSDRLAFRIDEACARLGIGRTSLYELVKTGQIKLIKIAGRSLVPASELERLIQRQLPREKQTPLLARNRSGVIMNLVVK